MQIFAHVYNGSQYRDIIKNWDNANISPSLIYSHRSTAYDRATYPSMMHFHDYYELLLYDGGEVRYVFDGSSHRLGPGDLVLIPPGKLHVSMIEADSTVYNRYVFYFFPDAFDAIHGSALLDFARKRDTAVFFHMPEEQHRQLLQKLHQLDKLSASTTEADKALSFATAIEVFYLLNNVSERDFTPDDSCSPRLREIQQYIDEHFQDITSVSQVAEHFFYSREYISRLFRRELHTTVADYLLTRRISYCRQLLAENASLLDICFQAGFGSVSAFNRAFRRVMGQTPAQYRRQQRKE